jgi:hypothetical protein
MSAQSDPPDAPGSSRPIAVSFGAPIDPWPWTELPVADLALEHPGEAKRDLGVVGHSPFNLSAEKPTSPDA